MALNFAEMLADVAADVTAWEASRGNAQEARNFLQAIEAQESRIDALNGVFEAVFPDVAPIEKLSDEQRAALTALRDGAKLSDELRERIAKVENVLGVADELELDAEEVEAAKTFLAGFRQAYAAQDAAQKSKSSGKSADGFGVRNVPGIIRVTFPDGTVRKSGVNSASADWTSLKDLTQVHAAKQGDELKVTLWPSLRAAHDAGQTSWQGVATSEGGVQYPFEWDANATS